MKQTVEEAASENILFNHRTVDRTLSGKDLAKFGEMNFVQGAEWKSKQSGNEVIVINGFEYSREEFDSLVDMCGDCNM